MPHTIPIRITIVLVVLLCVHANLSAVVFFSTADPDFNTTPPPGSLTNSGWDLQGQWDVFLGTPIGSNYFITARHVGGVPGMQFSFRGRLYTTTAKFDHPAADLTIWRVHETFPAFAQIYIATNEVARPLVVFGRGLRRGPEIHLNGELRGWKWGDRDLRMRWGKNQVTAVTSRRGRPISTNQPQFLRVTFETNTGPHEAHLSNGDSGGAVFIRDNDDIWKLAGINSAVDGKYNTNNFGEGFDATLFDERGFYKGSRREWTLQIAEQIQPSAFYAVRLSSYAPWIQRILTYGNPKGEMTVEHSRHPQGPYSRSLAPAVDPGTMTIKIPPPLSSRFYRVRAEEPVRITGITNSAAGLILGYE